MNAKAQQVGDKMKDLPIYTAYYLNTFGGLDGDVQLTRDPATLAQLGPNAVRVVKVEDYEAMQGQYMKLIESYEALSDEAARAANLLSVASSENSRSNRARGVLLSALKGVPLSTLPSAEDSARYKANWPHINCRCAVVPVAPEDATAKRFDELRVRLAELALSLCKGGAAENRVADELFRALIEGGASDANR